MKKVLFRSIPQAIRAVPELAAMCSEHNISSAQLLHAMQRVDPDLKLHTFHFKYAHTEKQLEVRQNYCREKVAWLDPMTAARRVQLERFVWWDEGTVQIGDLEHKTIKAWGSKEGLHSVDVLHLPSVKGQRPCKIHFIIAVSSHPAFHRTNGLVYFEFTTGTTHDKRLWNVYEGDEAGAHKYKVSNSVFTDCVAKCIITHQAVQLYCLMCYDAFGNTICKSTLAYLVLVNLAVIFAEVVLQPLPVCGAGGELKVDQAVGGGARRV